MGRSGGGVNLPHTHGRPPREAPHLDRPLRGAVDRRRPAPVPADRPRHLLLAFGQDRGERPSLLRVRRRRAGAVSERQRTGVAAAAERAGRAPQRGRLVGRIRAAARDSARRLLPFHPAHGPGSGGGDRSPARHAPHSVSAAAGVRGPDLEPGGVAVGRGLRAHRAAHRDLAAAARRAMARRRPAAASGHRVRREHPDAQLGGADDGASRTRRLAAEPAKRAHIFLQRSGHRRRDPAAFPRRRSL